MRIGLDVMGGDNAPQAILDGVLAALERLDESDELYLVGRRDVIEPSIADHPAAENRVHIVPANDVIAMD